MIFREGDRGDLLYLVAEGSIKISKRGRGGEQETLAFIQQDNFFGEMAVLDGETRSATATAAEQTVVGAVTDKTFQRILDLAPSRLHLNVLRSVAERLRNVNSHFIAEVIVIRLSDTGCGIPADILPRLFEPFVTHGKSNGTGLGMAIAKSIIDAHEGKISVASVPGHGTTVDIRLLAPNVPLVA